MKIIAKIKKFFNSIKKFTKYHDIKWFKFDVNKHYKDFLFYLTLKELQSIKKLLNSDLDDGYRFTQLNELANKYNDFVLKRFIAHFKSLGFKIHTSWNNYTIYIKISDIEKYKQLTFWLNGVNHIPCSGEVRTIRVSDHNAKRFRDYEDQFIIHKFIPNINIFKILIDEAVSSKDNT